MIKQLLVASLGFWLIGCGGEKPGTLAPPHAAHEVQPKSSPAQGKVALEQLPGKATFRRPIVKRAPPRSPRGEMIAEVRIALVRAKEHLDKGEHQLAIDTYTKVILLDPQSHTAYHNRGAANLELQRYEEAIVDFTEAIRLAGPNAVSYSSRGSAYLAKEKWDEAIDDFTKAIGLDPEDIEAYYGRGYARRESEQYEGAIADFTKAIRLGDRDSVTYFNRGAAHFELKQFEKAIDDFTEAIRLGDPDSITYFNRGTAYADSHKYDEAITDFSEAIRLDPNDSDAWVERGSVFMGKKEYQKANSDFSEAIRLDPENANAYAGLAWLWSTCPQANLRDGPKAVEYAQKACELTEWKEPVHFDTMAAAYAETGNFKQAVEWLKKALESPDYPKDELEKAQQRLKLYEQGKPYRDE